MSTFTTDLEVPRRALAIAAHPDDVEFGCGGTLAKWAAAGCEIQHLVCTDGSKGSWDPAQDRDELVEQRHEEQRAASRALGGRGEVAFLDQVDGELQANLANRERVAYWIRVFRPDVVLGHDPWKRYRLPPDHHHAGTLAGEGIVAARDPHFFPEPGEGPHRPSHLLLWEADEYDHVEDIDAGLDAKLAALLEHCSQYRTTMDIDDPSSAEQAERFRDKIRRRHAEAGEADGIAYAERFKLISKL